MQFVVKEFVVAHFGLCSCSCELEEGEEVDGTDMGDYVIINVNGNRTAIPRSKFKRKEVE